MLVIVLYDSGRYPDTAMSVVIGVPLPCTAVAVNTAQLRIDRFDGAKLLDPVDAAAMARVDVALRAVQDLPLAQPRPCSRSGRGSRMSARRRTAGGRPFPRGGPQLSEWSGAVMGWRRSR
ncbi:MULTISPECIES: hypothetical protein [unclassified Streptomyces]|uniref:hypothetical protein n=1 Tax=unclassified Streptomyces TaxID=2593676 RepID=UPI0020CA92B7|nr:hypothetical protein [Streptomyces sp. KAI 90]